MPSCLAVIHNQPGVFQSTELPEDIDNLQEGIQITPTP
jgi:hypothetical protein